MKRIPKHRTRLEPEKGNVNSRRGLSGDVCLRCCRCFPPHIITSNARTVDPGHRGVIYNRIGGISEKVIPEGTHFLIPWFQRVQKYDIRTQPRTMTSLTGTRDLQMVNISLRVLCHPDVDKLPTTYRQLGMSESCWGQRWHGA